ncbi:MAG TPA: DUF1707 and FHA domain-containing protein [Streptosporangiaceae bacterium]|nr:DUF1707 and FHA domain-containing protein [Streptosporangiaceae bacterium]
MRAPNNRLLTGQDLRASDAERDEAIGELRDRFAEGRLSHETFLYRMDAALRAKDRSELFDLFADLPGSHRGRSQGGQSVAGRLASLWQVPRHRLAARRWRARQAAASKAWMAAGDQPFGTRAAMAGHPDAGFLVLRETQSLCLPRQPDRRFTIGRAPSCDFTVADLSVSRWHARLYHEGGNWLLSDLGSTNGTRLNGWRVTSAVPVQPGDNVSFGSAAYVIIERPVAAGRPSGTD